MTFLAEMGTRLKTKWFNKYSSGLGDMLIATGALGWALSSAGQILGISFNKKISKDKKKFLIPQEIFDAVVNIVSFVVITRSCKKLTQWLASSGKITTKSISEFCTSHNIEITKGTNINKTVSKKIDAFKYALSEAKERNLNITEQESSKLINDGNEFKDFLDKKYAPFEEGMSTIGTVVGSVIASNIFTPFVRNYLAADRQKQAQMEEKLKKLDASSKITQPPALEQNRITIDEYKSRIITPGSGSMRV